MTTQLTAFERSLPDLNARVEDTVIRLLGLVDGLGIQVAPDDVVRSVERELPANYPHPHPVHDTRQQAIRDLAQRALDGEHNGA